MATQGNTSRPSVSHSGAAGGTAVEAAVVVDSDFAGAGGACVFALAAGALDGAGAGVAGLVC